MFKNSGLNPLNRVGKKNINIIHLNLLIISTKEKLKKKYKNIYTNGKEVI